MDRKSIIHIYVLVCLILVNTCFVVRQTTKINDLKEEILTDSESYNQKVEEKDKYISRLEEEVLDLQKQKVKSENQLKSYELLLKEYETPKVEDYSSSLDSRFRSYMSYKAITNTKSPQYKIVHNASVNKYGILEIDGRAVVAVGSGWGLKVGDKATVYTENDGSFKILVGDMKADCHTDDSNRVTLSNGCVVEFIIDDTCLVNSVKISGNVATISKYSGKVINIVKDE